MTLISNECNQSTESKAEGAWVYVCDRRQRTQPLFIEMKLYLVDLQPNESIGHQIWDGWTNGVQATNRAAGESIEMAAVWHTAVSWGKKHHFPLRWKWKRPFANGITRCGDGKIETAREKKSEREQRRENEWEQERENEREQERQNEREQERKRARDSKRVFANDGQTSIPHSRNWT